MQSVEDFWKIVWPYGVKFVNSMCTQIVSFLPAAIAGSVTMMDNRTMIHTTIIGEREICLQVRVVKSARKLVDPLKSYLA